MYKGESEELLHAMLEGVNAASSDLATLSSRLHHVPLALIQAAVFIQKQSGTVNEYQQLLNKEPVHPEDRDNFHELVAR